MVKKKFRFFQMQMKRIPGYAIKLGRPVFGKTPKRLMAINVTHWTLNSIKNIFQKR